MVWVGGLVAFIVHPLGLLPVKVLVADGGPLEAFHENPVFLAVGEEVAVRPCRLPDQPRHRRVVLWQAHLHGCLSASDPHHPKQWWCMSPDEAHGQVRSGLERSGLRAIHLASCLKQAGQSGSMWASH